MSGNIPDAGRDEAPAGVFRATPPLVLASASPRRRALVADMGLAVQIDPADIDESQFASDDPIRDALDAALAKARVVADRRPGRLVIAADTVVVAGGESLGKPANRDQARAFMRRLSGVAHTVATGLVVAPGKGVPAPGSDSAAATEIITTRVFFRPLTPDEIEAYIATDEPYDKAGGYGVQGRAGDFVERLEGDYFNVVGLPVAALARLLERFMDTSGLRLPRPPERWRAPRH